jgi:hypothetical protein
VVSHGINRTYEPYKKLDATCEPLKDKEECPISSLLSYSVIFKRKS